MNLKITACAALALWPTFVAGDTRPDAHAPIGIMGDHTHEQGELMFSYRFMHMSMAENLNGTSDLRADEVVTQPNAFGMPPTLRVVPTDMSMDMHMLGMMYAPSERMTLMVMTQYIELEMDHTTYMGAAGDTVLGSFTTRSSGLGDTSLAALIDVGGSPKHRWHLTAGLSIPTGSIDERDQILTPMNTRPTPRLPYPMQLGSGTYDLITGLTYNGSEQRWGWGGQWQSKFRLSENDEDYTLGDTHTLSAWLSYLLTDSLSLSLRAAYFDRGNIDGRDPRIQAPVQTADPDRQAAQRVDLFAGVNLLLPGHRHRLALEVGAPLHQDLEGPQLSSEWQLTLGWQYAP